MSPTHTTRHDAHSVHPTCSATPGVCQNTPTDHLHREYSTSIVLHTVTGCNTMVFFCIVLFYISIHSNTPCFLLPPSFHAALTTHTPTSWLNQNPIPFSSPPNPSTKDTPINSVTVSPTPFLTLAWPKTHTPKLPVKHAPKPAWS